MQMTCCYTSLFFSIEDYVDLQHDINVIYHLSKHNCCLSMKQNVNVCWFPKECPNLFINCHKLELVQSYKYIGVHISSDLCWAIHSQSLCTKARQIRNWRMQELVPRQAYSSACQIPSDSLLSTETPLLFL